MLVLEICHTKENDENMPYLLHLFAFLFFFLISL